MTIPAKPFQKPMPCSKLMRLLDSDKWPGPGDWAYVPLRTLKITPATLVTVRTFSSEDLETDEEDQTFRKVQLKGTGLTPFLNRTLMEDVVSSLKHEFTLAKNDADAKLLNENREALLMMALTKYWADDAFLSVYSWKTKSGKVIPGAIDQFRK